MDAAKQSIQCIHLDVVNSPTIITRVVQIVKRRRINIKSFLAEEDDTNKEDAFIRMIVEADMERVKLLNTQLEKTVDVISSKVV